MKVREVIELLELDGWHLVRTKGSHRQYQHDTKRGTITVAGKYSTDAPKGTVRRILKQAGLS